MARKVRKDITVKGLVKKLEIAPGSIKNANGRAARSDKTLESLQKDAARAAKKPITMAVKPKAIAKVAKTAPKTPDQKIASLRKVKSIPKATPKLSRKVSAAIKKTVKK